MTLMAQDIYASSVTLLNLYCNLCFGHPRTSLGQAWDTNSSKVGACHCLVYLMSLDEIMSLRLQM